MNSEALKEFVHGYTQLIKHYEGLSRSILNSIIFLGPCLSHLKRIEAYKSIYSRYYIPNH